MQASIVRASLAAAVAVAVATAALAVAAIPTAEPAVAKPSKKGKRAKAARDNVIACTGGLARDANHDAVVRAFGAGNVTYRALQVPGYDDTKGTVVFAGRPARQIEIVWKDQKSRSRPSLVTFGPAWRTAEGITVGADLAAVEKLNGGPFTLSGFEWDFGGTVTDWKGGTLAKQNGGCQLVVRFGISYENPGKAHDAVGGSKDFSSRDPKMIAVKPAVREIAIQYE
jgi:hypothetical protein